MLKNYFGKTAVGYDIFKYVIFFGKKKMIFKNFKLFNRYAHAFKS